MNCDAARRRLLAGEHPDRPTDDDVRRHVAACPVCRAWGRRLALVERQIPRLPVPPSSAKSAFVRRFLRTGGPVVRRVPLPWTTPPRQRGLQKLSLAVAIAAVLAVFTLGWWTWPHVPTAPPHPQPSWVAEINKERDAIGRLAEPGQRVTQAGALEAKLRQRAEALTQAGDANSLISLATVYREFVGGDLMDDARALPAAQRADVLAPVLEDLRRAESQFSEAAASHAGAATAGPLQDLAKAARDGKRDIQSLLKAA